MGIGGISIWQLVIILAIVLLLFGTKRLRGLGSDLGGAIKGFKKAIKEEPPAEDADAKTDSQAKVDADDPDARVDAADRQQQKTESKQ